MNIISYFLWPNLGVAGYDNPRILALLVFSVALIVLSSLVRLWRQKMASPMTRKLSKTWASALFWFGIVSLLLVLSRAEGIQYLSMRIWWVVLGMVAVFYVYLQLKIFRARYYEVLPTEAVIDARAKYLPHKKK